MYATVSLFVSLAFAVVQASPYYYPQQRQLFYPVLPQYPQYYPRQVYYSPPTAANLVAPVPAAVRYPVAPPAKSVVYYGAPALAPYPGNFIYSGGADETGSPAEGAGGLWGLFGSISQHFPWGPGNAEEAAPSVEGAEAGTGGAPAASPEKIEQENSQNSEQPKEGEENKNKEGEAEKPAQPTKAQKVKAAPKGGPQKYVVVGQPQFYGNFAPQRVNPAAVLPSADHGAVSSYLLLKNYPGYRLAPQFPVPQVPQVYQVPQVARIPQAPQAAEADAELIPAGQPGAAALGYQKLLKEAAAEAARQSKEYDDSSVAVDAASSEDSSDADPQDDKPDMTPTVSTQDAGDKTEEEETGTSD